MFIRFLGGTLLNIEKFCNAKLHQRQWILDGRYILFVYYFCKHYLIVVELYCGLMQTLTTEVVEG